MIIVETERTKLTSMVDVDHLNYSINEHMKRIKEHSDGKKIMQLFQIMGQHSVVYKGYSYMNNKTMAKAVGVSVRTIQRYTELFERLHVLLKVPTNRKNNRGQTSNTYVILPVLKSVVSRVCHGGCHTLNPSFKPLKQESNYINPTHEKIVTFVANRINDAIEQGTRIESLSSYVDRIVRSVEKQALFDENIRLEKARRQRIEENSRLAVELGIKKKQELPFYDWLNA